MYLVRPHIDPWIHLSWILNVISLKTSRQILTPFPYQDSFLCFSLLLPQVVPTICCLTPPPNSSFHPSPPSTSADQRTSFQSLPSSTYPQNSKPNYFVTRRAPLSPPSPHSRPSRSSPHSRPSNFLVSSHLPRLTRVLHVPHDLQRDRLNHRFTTSANMFAISWAIECVR